MAPNRNSETTKGQRISFSSAFLSCGEARATQCAMLNLLRGGVKSHVHRSPSTPADGRSGSKCVAALRAACCNGHLVIAKWLVDYFKLGADDARALDNYALRTACGHGHIRIASFLTHRFDLTPADARAVDNHALSYACYNGHFYVVEWLVSRFALTPTDGDVGGALRHARTNGHLDIVKFLTDWFRPTIKPGGSFIW